jgi:hypothetical protein
MLALGLSVLLNLPRVDYTGWVDSRGRIKYGEKWHDSPSAAADAILDSGAVNGWQFWKYKNDNSNLVVLATLREK